MIGAQGVLEPGMCGTRVDQERVPELPDVAEPLKRCAVHHAERRRIDPDVVPQRVPHDFEAAGQRHNDRP